METLQLLVRQGLRGQDLTGLVKPYVGGTALRVPVDFSGHAGEFRFELDVADGAAPDMETLQVRVRKGWFGKDITDEVEPYVEGAAIEVPAVDFSGHTGDFRIEIRIRDARDRPGEARVGRTARSGVYRHPHGRGPGPAG